MGLRQTAYGSIGYQPDAVDLVGSFAPNGSSAIVATSNVGDRSGGIWSVARAGVGLFVVTFVDSYYGPLFAGAELFSPSASQNWAQIVAFNPTANVVNTYAAKTLTIQVVNNSGAATEVGPTTGLIVNFWAQATQTALGGR
jgi:hypothetical protein